MDPQYGATDSATCFFYYRRRRREIKRFKALRKALLSKRFSLDDMEAYDVVSQLRFSKQDIRRIASAINWREVTVLGEVRTKRRRYIASKVEAICVLLSRLAMHMRNEDLETRLFRRKSAINEIFYEALDCFLTWDGRLISDCQSNFVRKRGQLYAVCIAAKSKYATQSCIGFIDGTLIEIAPNSGTLQRAAYSGHKRRHGLKLQAI
jgi:hypothetical protein